MAASAAFDPREYWRRTKRRLLTLVGIWFLAGPVLSIVLVEPLNRFSLGGVPFGFWMGQQGSIYIFVVLIFVNAWMADRLDREFDVHETAATTRRVEGGGH